MSNILIVGAGQLGSRHLQGVLKVKSYLSVYVLDKSKNSLHNARIRAEEVPSKHQVSYLTEWEEIPDSLELVIIATGADVRYKVVKHLLSNYHIQNLVLEKVLFQDLNSYERVRELIAQTKTKVWVNHPRRMFDHYKKLKQFLAENKESLKYEVFGGNWDLACNGLHFIDLIKFLSDSNVDSLDFKNLDDEILDSKRFGCVEFTGSFSGRLKNGDSFTISSINGDIEPITIVILSQSNRWVIQEDEMNRIIHIGKQNDFKEKIYNVRSQFQSDLSTEILNNILTKQIISLTDYEDACDAHIPFVKGLLDVYNEKFQVDSEVCPIT